MFLLLTLIQYPCLIKMRKLPLLGILLVSFYQFLQALFLSSVLKAKTNPVILVLNMKIVAVETLGDQLLLVKKIYHQKEKFYTYSLQHYLSSKGVYYLGKKYDLAPLILYPHEMTFEGKLKFVGTIVGRPLISISFNHVTERRDYIY